MLLYEQKFTSHVEKCFCSCTYQIKGRRVFHQGGTATKERENHYQRSRTDQYVDTDVILVHIENCNPFVKSGLRTDEYGEREQAGTDNLNGKGKKTKETN